MSLSPVKHYYSKSSIEAWFRHLTRDWEGFFSDQQLKKGREIYLSNGIREIELNLEDAIVQLELNDKAYYSVITWTKKGPSVRASSRKKDRAEAIAVAGIYQIEELIADQLSELTISEFGDDEWVDDGQPVTEGDSVGSVDSDNETALVVEDEPPANRNRPLVLTFKGTEEGLGFEACWLNGDGNKEQALNFGEASGSPLSEIESESLIRLTTLSRKSGFVLHKESKRFLMSDIGRFIPFLSHELPKWRSHFTIVRETEVKRLMQGIQSVEVEAFVAESGGDEGHYDIEWNYQTEGRDFDRKEYSKISKRRGQPVYLPNRGIVQLTDSQVNLIDRWSEFKKHAGKSKVDRYMILSLFGEGGSQLNLSKTLLNWRKKLFNQPRQINTLVTELRDYQHKGISWIVHVLRSGCHCLLADEMGLGKTAQILGVLNHFRCKESKPSIVFCPASVIPVWKHEVERFFPEIRVMQVTGQRSITDAQWADVDLVVCSYTQLRRNVEAFKNLEFECCVLDEAQVIKNPDTKVSKSSYSIQSKYRIAVTGTPIENHYKDVWSIFYFLMPGLLGNRSRFESMIEEGGEGFSLKLRNQLAPFILRRTKEEVISELPDKNEMQLNCSMTDIQKKEYSRLVQEGLKKITSVDMDTVQQRSFSFFALLTRLRQVCCDPGLLPWMDVDPSKSAKIQLLIEKLADIYATKHRVVIFSQFVGLIERLKTVLEKEFPDLNLFMLTGKTVDRAKPVKQFQESDHPATILVSLKAGGTGITLHAADYVFLLDPWWNPSVEAQAIDRVHRLGQENPVFVYRVIATGTIEERVQELQQEKREMFKELIEDLKDVSEHRTHLDTLKELLSLQH
jgi:superfamily II DNA or RNA helicase